MSKKSKSKRQSKSNTEPIPTPVATSADEYTEVDALIFKCPFHYCDTCVEFYPKVSSLIVFLQSHYNFAIA